MISEGGLYSTRDVKGGGGLLPPLYAIQLFKQGVGRGRGAAAVRRGTGVRGARCPGIRVIFNSTDGF